jgi:hypothetical protein
MAFEQKSLDDYIDVAQRIAEFRAAWPGGSLRPADPAEPFRIVQAQGFEKDGQVVTQTFIVVVAAAYRGPEDQAPGVGMAWEIFPGRTPYTRGSELQNAETSAWGRAIIAVGAADAKRGIASREEVQNRRAEREDGLPVNADGSLSRSRTSDEEKLAAGVQTSGQLAEHTALRPKPAENRAGKARAGAVDDVWTGGPAGMSPAPSNVPPEDAPGSIDGKQRSRLIIAFRALGVEDRMERLQQTVDMIGRPVESSSDLSFAEAADVVRQLEARLAGQTKAGMR